MTAIREWFIMLDADDDDVMPSYAHRDIAAYEMRKMSAPDFHRFFTNTYAISACRDAAMPARLLRVTITLIFLTGYAHAFISYATAPASIAAISLPAPRVRPLRSRH